MYYLFGAGNNGVSALKFFGKENIIAFVDNSEAKIGTVLLEVPIIGIEQLLEQWQGETIIITAYLEAGEVVGQLQAVGIYDYFICPYVQTGFYTCDQMIEYWDLLQTDSYAVYDQNPIAEVLIEHIREKRKNIAVHYITEGEWKQEKLPIAETLLIIKEGVPLQAYSQYSRVIFLLNEMIDRKKLDYSYLEEFHHIKNGEKCVLVGNGPSLRADDLQKVWELGIAAFGCNRIDMLYSETDWRPDYYVVCDSLMYEKCKYNLPRDGIVFIGNFGGNIKNQNNIYPYYTVGERYFPGYPHFSDDFVKGVYGGRTVMYTMLQIAAYMGFAEIYLIGVDFSWGEDGKDTHFCKDYADDSLIREAMRYKEEQEHAYIAAKKYADVHGIKIYNATRGGHLEVFERVDFDEAF